MDKNKNAACKTRWAEKKLGPSLLITAASSNKHGASSTMEGTENQQNKTKSASARHSGINKLIEALRERSQKRLLSPGSAPERPHEKARGTDLPLSGTYIVFSVLVWELGDADKREQRSRRLV